MENIISLDSENNGVGAQNMKIAGEKTMKGSKVGGAQRKRLSDISNLKEQPTLQKRDTKPRPSLLLTYEYVDKLQKENMTLMKVLAERTRIIEISGSELEKLRINYQKLQQQNLQLAQANSQMLADLNSGKERLKALQHELGCKNGIIMSRQLDLERKGKSATLQLGEVGTTEYTKAGESINANQDNRPCKTNRRRQSKQESLQPEVPKVEGKRPCLRRQSAKFKTEEPVAANEHIMETENSNSNDASECKETSVHQVEVQKVEGKRPCSRRQSARFKAEEPSATNDLFEIENSTSTVASQCKETSVLETEVQKGEGKSRHCLRRQSARFKLEEPVAMEDSLEIENSNSTSAFQCKEILCEVGKIDPTSSVEKEDNGNSTDRYEVQECRRASVGRPSRRAAEKVISYKEIPINVKMRRQV